MAEVHRTIKFHNERLGPCCVRVDRVVRAPDGLMGMPSARRFALVMGGLVRLISDRTGRIFWFLVDIDDADRLLVVTPGEQWWPPASVPAAVASLVDSTPERVQRLIVVDSTKGMDGLVGDFRRPVVMNIDTMLALHADLGEDAEAWAAVPLAGGGG